MQEKTTAEIEIQKEIEKILNILETKAGVKDDNAIYQYLNGNKAMIYFITRDINADFIPKYKKYLTAENYSRIAKLMASGDDSHGIENFIKENAKYLSNEDIYALSSTIIKSYRFIFELSELAEDLILINDNYKQNSEKIDVGMVIDELFNLLNEDYKKNSEIEERRNIDNKEACRNILNIEKLLIKYNQIEPLKKMKEMINSVQDKNFVKRFNNNLEKIKSEGASERE